MFERPITLSAIAFLSLGAIAPVHAQDEAAAPECACKDLLTPTQMVDAYWTALNDPANEVPQADLGWRYLNLITMDGETIPERRETSLALGEAAFLTFQPGVSRYYFEQVVDGDDLIARHAMDRIMQITFRAYDDKPAAKEMVDRFHDRFPPTILNNRGRYQQIRNFADWHFSEGRAEEAIALIVDELERLPPDAPYYSFSLPIVYAEQIGQSSQADVISTLTREKLDALKNLQAQWRDAEHAAKDDPMLTMDMPDWYWLAQNVLPGETFMMARARQLDGLVSGLENILSTQEAS